MRNSQAAGRFAKWLVGYLTVLRQPLARALKCNAFMGCDEFKRVFEECPRLA